MSTVTVSEKGQVVIPATIRRRLGIAPGSKLDFELEGDSIRVRLRKSVPPSHTDDGYALRRCDLPGERRLADFDVADATTASPLRGHTEFYASPRLRQPITQELGGRRNRIAYRVNERNLSY